MNALESRGFPITAGKASVNMAAQSITHIGNCCSNYFRNITYYITRKSVRKGEI